MSAITRIRLFGSRLGDLHHLVGPGVGAVRGRSCRRRSARATRRRFSISASRSMIGMAHNSPSLSGGDRLVGGDEAAEALRVDPAVAVRDRLQRDVVDARQPGRRAVRQARQFPAVAFGQVPLGRADLLFDQVEVVEQPFAGRRDPAVRRDRRGQQVAGFEQDALVLGQPREQLVRRAARRQPVRAPRGSCRAAPSGRR